MIKLVLVLVAVLIVLVVILYKVITNRTDSKAKEKIQALNANILDIEKKREVIDDNRKKGGTAADAANEFSSM